MRTCDRLGQGGRVAEVGKIAGLRGRMLDPHDELLASISEYCDAIYEHLLLAGVADPQPRHFVIAALSLRVSRATNGLPEVPRDVVVRGFLFLVPSFER